MINHEETELAGYCISYAIGCGASAARVSLSKSTMDSCTMLNGELDKVTHSADRSIFIYIYADNRYGTFSTNRLEKKELETFISNAVSMVRLLGEDICRCLPEAERTERMALTGMELDLYDPEYEQSDTERRLERAKTLSIYKEICSGDHKDFHLISEECEYSESVEDNYIADSNGFKGRHIESSFSCFSEMTVADLSGNKYSGFWWDATPKIDELKIEDCGRLAIKRAVSRISPKKRRSGKYRMVIDRNVSSRVVSPIFAALNASSIQQKMSFLEDALGKQIFPEGLTIMDMARSKGKSGARLFDSEGVATKDAPIIEGGVVKQYFVNTYMSKKMGLEPTIEDISRPCVMPYIKGKSSPVGEKYVSSEDILHKCKNGILVTGFNGGNSNPVTGDFSFGVEGFAFSNGKITYPIHEMLITGNLITLWNNLLAAGTDARKSARWQIPTLAFENVSFSA